MKNKKNWLTNTRIGTFEKLLERFLGHPKDFTYDELNRLSKKLGYEEITKGKTSGLRVTFIDKKIKHVIRVHKPHPSNIVKEYVVKMVIRELQDKRKI